MNREDEALEKITMDMLIISREKNRKLTIALMISIILNVVMLSAVFQVRIGDSQMVDEALVLTTIAVNKPSEHIITRSKLKKISDIKTFEELLERCILTDDDKFILRQHYLQGRSFLSIATEMGYSEDAIKHRHQKILKRIKALL